MTALGLGAAAAALAVAAGAAAQAVTGIGFALVCAPFLVALLGPREGVRTVVLLSAVLNAAVLAREHRGVLVTEGALLLAPAVVVTPLAGWAVRRLPEDALALAAGVLVLASAAALALGLRLHRARGRAGAVAAGGASAVMNVVGGIGGPAAALYAVNAGWPAGRTRPTLQAYFLVLNLVTLAIIGLPSLEPLQLAALAGGWVAGTLVLGRVDDRLALRATLALAGAGGLVAVVRALAG